MTGLVLAASAAVAADGVPLTRPATFASPSKPETRPPTVTAFAPSNDLPKVTAPPAEERPTACELRLTEFAVFSRLPPIVGPGECGAGDVVRLEAVKLPDDRRVTLNPPASLRCPTAEAVAKWVRDDMAPAAAELGSPLAAISNYDSFSCRGRNRIVGAKLSEHGKANALDIRSIRLANGTMVEFTNPIVPKDFREAMRKSACARFMTVLGPGSDGCHEGHIHVDMAERARGSRLCRWDVREPPTLLGVPLPLPRPSAQVETGAARE